MDEFSLIDRYFCRPVTHTSLGVGDDAAIVAPAPGHELAVSVDTLVEAVHFPADLPAEDVGYRALAVNLSDMSAMGARPRWVTLALTLPHADEAWLSGFASGFTTLAELHDIDLIGGDTTRGPLTISVQILGELPAGRALTRAAGRAGDDIYVSGTLGDAAAGLELMAAPANYAECSDSRMLVQKFCRPEVNVELGPDLLPIAHAAIDVSDGLLQDLGHVLRASRCGARIECNNIPLSAAMLARVGKERGLELALSGGDDYELLFSAAPAKREALASLPVSRIGQLTEGSALELLRDGKPAAHLGGRGYQHFGSN